jgi:hypothetical protein
LNANIGFHACRPDDSDTDEINPTTGNRSWGKSRFSGYLPTKITECYTCMQGKSFLSADGMKSSSVFARVAASLLVINLFS